jgi:hypothetical protein
MELYLPGRDVIRTSDGTWKEPRYIEISNSPLAGNLVGLKVKGISSGTTAIVESYIKEPINQSIVGTLYLSNIFPKGGEFDIGEKIVDVDSLTNGTANLVYIFANAPSVLGSMDKIEILNGGQNFKVGDILKIAHRDPITNEVISSGIEGIVKVTELTTGRGQLSFSIPNGGFGYRSNTNTFVYRGDTDTTGQGAEFSVGNYTNLEEITYNTDIVADYLDVLIGATAYGLPGDPTANLSSNIGSSLSFANAFFGSIGTLTNIKTGNSYTAIPNIFVRDSLISNSLLGTITYTTSSNVVTGTGTEFSRFFANNDTIFLQGNTSLSNTIEYHVIKTVANNTSLTLYGPPAKNSTASAKFRVAPNPIEANFLPSVHDYIEANVYAIPFASSASVIKTTKAINSGKGYIDGEEVKLYLYGGMNTPTILTGGQGYANGELLLFAGGDPNIPAIGTIETNGSGNVTSVDLTFNGSGYQSLPRVYVKSANGTGATFDPSILEFNTNVEVTGNISKAGIGKQKGYWTTTRGFLNSDKYIHDSYFYQDFSYQINTAVTLSKYRDILYNTFHIAGTEMFGKFMLNTVHEMRMTIADESDVAISSI